MPITDSKTFCVLPWIHMNLNPDGAMTLCCQSHEPIFDEQGRAINAQTHSLTEVWNAPAMRAIRRDMAEGRLRPHCQACVSTESLGRMSHRSYTNAQWLKHHQSAADIRRGIETSKDWTAPTLPRYVDLRLGNLCNLKCTACKPLFSSQIERDPVHARWVLANASYTRLQHRFGDIQDWQEAPEVAEEINALSGSLSLIQLAGGEPTINHTQLALLKTLCEQGRAGEIDLEVVTNLSHVRPDVYDLFAQFRSLNVALSIDGTGEVYEYVRYPGKWSSLMRNIERLRETNPEARLKINFVLQAINALNAVALFDWALDAGISRVTMSIGRGLDHYNDVRILPPTAKAAMRARFQDFFRRRATWLATVPAYRASIDSVLAEIETNDFPDELRRERVVAFMQFVNDLDQSRGLSFRAVAPELYDAVVDYHGYWDQAPRYA